MNLSVLLIFLGLLFTSSVTQLSAKDYAELIPSRYRYYFVLSVYSLSSQNLSKEQIKSRLAHAQSKFDDCGIYLGLDRIEYMNHPQWIEEWETFAFNNGEISEWETWFFSQIFPRQNGIIYVDSLNWTMEGQGTWATGYGSFIHKHYQLDTASKVFYDDYMVGHVVMGLYRASWTLAHELGHAILNLEHVDNPKDLMFNGAQAGTPQFDSSGLLISDNNPRFTPKQCAKGILDNPRLLPNPNFVE
ncbi:MAG: hypothetical protein ISR65_18825 [Bacteriovoracaceae bacterium]|nr:hypothetical protein [Bacteriovoracaceae bacterium]